ncbi:MAG: apolipoprotein N-acyltransferase [Victivallales bacterium]|nr:apolipoprotein N-acyltransferase [Victivallales bacterium]
MPDLYPIHLLRKLRWARLGAALLSGLALSCAFAPLEWWWMAWLAFLPLLVLPTPQSRWERLGVGMIFGYSHFATALHWLNTVGFGAGWLLAVYCALYPAVWYYLYSAVLWSLKPRESLSEEQSETELASAHRAGAALWQLRYRVAVGVAALAAAIWTALEWVRSWLFTGFPWNQLGISQVETIFAFPAWDFGIFFISFLILFTNGLLILAVAFLLHSSRRYIPLLVSLAWIVLWVAMLFPLAAASPSHSERLKGTTLRILAIQGDVPECRDWNEQIFDMAWNRYADLTREAFRACAENPPDLILWPEGALPAPITYAPYATRLRKLLQELKTPILLGALDIRPQPGDPPEEAPVFNTAFLLDADSPILANPYADRGEYYDKIHRVPFGEYVPFGKYFPWLVDAIGMGRDLTPGQNYKLFEIKGVKIGVNICFEDAFPEISRRFAQDGADLLITITNDCWYRQSSGARQHRNHAVFRAIETHRSLLRSGNNSDTCLISKRGWIRDPICGPDGSAFGPGWHLYELNDTHFATTSRVSGNLFAHLCALATLLTLVWLQWKSLRHHAKMAQVMKTAHEKK